MIAELIILIIMSVITGLLLERKHKVAFVSHCVLTFVLFALSFLTTDISFIKDIATSIVPKLYYDSLYEAVHKSVPFLDMGFSSFMVIELSMFVALPLLSIVTFIEEIREQIKNIKLEVVDFSSLLRRYITLVEYPEKDFRHTQNETYLILGKLLN